MADPTEQLAVDRRELGDTELLKRYLEGDSESFAVLMERYRKELYNFLVRFTGDHALAEDVFQETFLQLHISAGTFDPTRKLKPWLFTIAANKGRDAMRSRCAARPPRWTPPSGGTRAIAPATPI